MSGTESRDVPELLRAAADRLEGMHAAAPLPGRQSNVASPSLTSSQVEVAGLFTAYGHRRPPAAPRRFPPRSTSLQPPAAKKARYTHTFVCLSDHLGDTVPPKYEKIELTTAGLGEKRLCFQGNENDAVYFRSEIESAYPPLRETGGFELLRITGTTRSRDLCVIQSPEQGYTVQHLRNPATGIGQATLYVRPLQKSIDFATRALTSPPQAGPLTRCLLCNQHFPFNSMKSHVQKCTGSLSPEIFNLDSDDEVSPPGPSTSRSALSLPGLSTSRSAFNLPSPSTSQRAVSLPGPSTSQSAISLPGLSTSRSALNLPSQSTSQRAVSLPGPSTSQSAVSLPGLSTAQSAIVLPGPSTPASALSASEPSGSSDSRAFLESFFSPEWKVEPDSCRAAMLFKRWLLSDGENERVLVLRMDLGDDIEDQEASLMSTYKAVKENWARPIRCKLEGDRAIGDGVMRFFFSRTIALLQHGFHLNLGHRAVTRLFDGEPDHLVPCNSERLIESDMFFVAGRMMGHSFLHGGPCVSGISPAIVHVLFGGTPETATVVIEDCADLDIRSTIQLLEGDAELTEEEVAGVNQLARSWDIDIFTQTNRRWLYDRLLLGAVIRRGTRQIRQLKKGLKDTEVWGLFTERPDTIPLMFPRDCESAPSSEFIIERIVWPVLDEEDDDYDAQCTLAEKCRVAGYLRTYIENASSEQLKALLKFWIAWESSNDNVEEMVVHVVQADSLPVALPTSSTCFRTLRLPAHYEEYDVFVHEFEACIGTSDTGFGMV